MEEIEEKKYKLELRTEKEMKDKKQQEWGKTGGGKERKHKKI